MCVAHDHAAIFQNDEALGFADAHIEHFPLAQERAGFVVKRDATGGVEHGEFVVIAAGDAARRGQ